MSDRYWWDNSLDNEADRLRLLEAIADPRSVALLEGVGVAGGWHCAELGAGAGSMAAWLSDRVGETGSVLAVDRNTALLRHLMGRPNVEIVKEEIEDFAPTPGSLDLIHTRNVLMHLDAADAVLSRLVELLRPGGYLVVEEADYYAVAGITSPALSEVATALVQRWTWARTIPNTIARLPVADIQVTIDASMLQGGSAEAAFWTHTFRSAEQRLVGTEHEPASGATPVRQTTFDEAIALLADETFWTPFASVICVTCRRG